MFWFIYDHSQVLQSSQKYVQSVAEYGLKLAYSILKFKVTLIYTVHLKSSTTMSVKKKCITSVFNIVPVSISTRFTTLVQ
jgi:hypothetical protein